ncbi:MAG: sulfatase-like hydrolase/transferase [Planctomycetota bacterium]|nr:sulfatase-like hydrolase/transferase [Planctomycetota bacterium]MDA1163170.1 sulfatase-like hydrolase/transferase [Planctomycetota bacterium]
MNTTCRCLLCRVFIVTLMLSVMASAACRADKTRPNIILVMADDQGWGQTGYYNNPVLKTPHLDAMAANGLRFDRYYAAAPVCSPTRASVLTGRTNLRTGVLSHGYALRRQEKTIATALRNAGYATGHFGKWHLNGLRGPGVPVLAEDSHNPGVFGFDEWLSVTNFFDRDPIMSRDGQFVEFKGDSSEIIVSEALKFIDQQANAKKPFLAVIWYGTPHNPFMASEEDTRSFAHLDTESKDQHGELVAMDRSIGALRQGLKNFQIADDTLVWFTSDNGGLPKIKPSTVGGLRGFKGSLYEGGLRVPAIVEWPAHIKTPRATEFPAVAMDIFPTVADILGLPDSTMLLPQDGISLKGLFTNDWLRRKEPISFSCFGNSALLDNNYKLLQLSDKKNHTFELYDLATDPKETTNLYATRPEVAARMRELLESQNESIKSSLAGKDYPEGRVNDGEPEPRFWTEVDAYRPYFVEWQKRPEYASRLKTKAAK